MFVDAIAGLPLDVADDGAQAGVVGVAAATAAGTDHVVVVRGLARHVGVVAAGQVETLDCTQLREDIQRPEDGGSTDAETAAPGIVDEVGGREVAVASGDQVDDGPASAGLRDSRPGRGPHRWGRRSFPRRDDTQYQYDLSNRGSGRSQYPSTTGPSSAR